MLYFYKELKTFCIYYDIAKFIKFDLLPNSCFNNIQEFSIVMKPFCFYLFLKNCLNMNIYFILNNSKESLKLYYLT